MTREFPGKFLHECPDWDYLEIDEYMGEFASCACDFGQMNEEAELFRYDRLSEIEQNQKWDTDLEDFL